MIENASLCISLNFHDEPTPMRAKRSLLLSRRSSFHGRKQNVRFVGILAGNFAATTCVQSSCERLHQGTCRVCRIHRNVCNRAGRDRTRFLRPLEAVPRFSRALVKSIGRLVRRAFRSIGSPRNVIALPANPRQVSSIHSLLRFGLLAFDSSTTNHRRRHARWFSKWLLHPISLSRMKTAINHRAIYQIIE